jgi:hypothetical protein
MLDDKFLLLCRVCQRISIFLPQLITVTGRNFQFFSHLKFLPIKAGQIDLKYYLPSFEVHKQYSVSDNKEKIT